MRGRPLIRAVAAAVAALGVLPATAGAAAIWSIDALDAGGVNAWSPDTVDATVGDTVQWTFGSASTNHDINVMPPGVPEDNAEYLLNWPAGSPPVPYTVSQPGEYRYFCSLHGRLDPGGMNGRIVVVPAGDPGNPGNPGSPGNPGNPGNPGSPGGGSGGAGGGRSATPGPLRNLGLPAGALEEGDTQRPALTEVAAGGLRAGVRVRFRLSEPGSVSVRILRGRRLVRSVRLAGRPAGANAATIRDRRRLKPGRYAVQVRATDRAGLESARWSGRVRIAG